MLSKSLTSNEVQINIKSLESKGTYFAIVLDLDGNVVAIKNRYISNDSTTRAKLH